MSSNLQQTSPIRKLAAIMFTDIVGYTALMGKDEASALEILRKSRAIHQSLITNYSGKWLKEMGDGVLAEFNSAYDSVCCAIEIQDHARRELDCKIRIGIHLGDVTVENDDIFGDGVNIASRIQSIADPGGIYVSESIQRLLRSRSDIDLEYLGEAHLKNVSEPIKTYYVKGQFFPVPSQNKIKELAGGDRKRIPVIAKIAMVAVILSVFAAIYWFSIREPFIESDKVKSIAVLAFKDMSPDHDQEYFSDGISDELLNLLTKIPELRVISRTSSFSYKGKNVTLEKIGKELDVTHILEGSVRKSGNTLRITTQLIKVADGSHLWSETYDRDMEDVFKIQDDIANAVIIQLKISLLGDIAKSTKVNPDAYALYLRANHLYQQFTKEGNEKAEDIIKQSIAIDSTYAPSWNLLSGINLIAIVHFNQKLQKDGFEYAKTAVQKSLDLDNNYAPAYAQLSLININLWDFDEAEKNINKAMMLDDRNSNIINAAIDNAIQSGRLEEALKLEHEGIKLDPNNYVLYLSHGLTYYFLTRFDDAYDAFNKNYFYAPNTGIIHTNLSLALTRQGKLIEALKEAEKEPDDFWNLYARTKVLFSLSRKKEADSLLVHFIDKYSDFGASNIADIYAFRGEINNAFKWLNIAFELPERTLLYNINFPSFRILYNDPRWNVLLAKMKLPKDHWLLEKKN